MNVDACSRLSEPARDSSENSHANYASYSYVFFLEKASEKWKFYRDNQAGVRGTECTLINILYVSFVFFNIKIFENCDLYFRPTFFISFIANFSQLSVHFPPKR